MATCRNDADISPGSPYARSMEDAELARRAADGDQAAWAAIYDRYADRLHDYCHSILRDRHEAADALHDAFVTAATKIGQLRSADRLRPWLYAICRTQSLAALRRRTRETPDDAVADMTPPTYDHSGYADAELRRLVADAAGGLAAKDRAILDLHLRHGLEGKDLAEALGVSAHTATVQLGRVRGHVERSLSALLVGRTGRGDCPDLDAILAGWDGELSPLIRKRVARHIDDCAVCGERRRRMVSPMALLGSVPFLPAPPELREEVLHDIALVAARPPRADPGAVGARTWKVAAGFAGVLLIGGVLYGVQRPGTTPGIPSGIAAGPSVLATPPGPGSASATTTARAAVATPPPGPPSSATVPTTEPPTTTTPPATPPTTTVPPGDTTPPGIAKQATDRSWIAAGDASCGTAVASVHVADESPVKATLHWQQGSAGAVRAVPMEDQGDGSHIGTVGPVDKAGEDILWWVTATDAAGNTARSGIETVEVRTSCEPTIG